MGGLSRIARMHGGIKVTDKAGNTTNYVWDYVADKAVHDAEMPLGSPRHAASEKKRYEEVRAFQQTKK
jgi:hypothetical protein